MWYDAQLKAKPQTEDTKDKVVCRPAMTVNARTIWIVWAIAVPLYWLLLSAARGCKDPAIAGSIQTPVFLLGVIMVPFTFLWPPAAFYVQRAWVVASSDGLWWRGAFRSRFASWQEVTDYYDTYRVSTDGRYTVYHWMSVETRQGRMRLYRSDGGWTHEAELRDYITTKATQAKAKAWGVLRRRPEDFPVVCHYDTRVHRHAPRFLKEWHGITLAAVVAYFAWSWATTHTFPGWGWLLTPTGLFLIAKEIIILALHPTYAETRRRLDQRIILASDGVTFEDGPRKIAATWDEISDFYTIGLWGQRYVETVNGTFSFLWTLQEGELLQQMLLNNATSAGQIIWRSRLAAPKHSQTMTA